jgi:hypothetical protein
MVPSLFCQPSRSHVPAGKSGSASKVWVLVAAEVIAGDVIPAASAKRRSVLAFKRVFICAPPPSGYGRQHIASSRRSIEMKKINRSMKLTLFAGGELATEK